LPDSRPLNGPLHSTRTSTVQSGPSDLHGPDAASACQRATLPRATRRADRSAHSCAHWNMGNLDRTLVANLVRTLAQTLAQTLALQICPVCHSLPAAPVPQTLPGNLPAHLLKESPDNLPDGTDLGVASGPGSTS
jgi:hypothetical protein